MPGPTANYPGWRQIPLLLSSPHVPPCPPENQQLCQQRGDCAWPAASRAARTGQVLAGAAGAPHWEQAGPGCQGCRINKAAHRLAGREAAGRRENRCLRSAAADTKGPLSPPPPWPWGAAPFPQAPDQRSGQPGGAGGEGRTDADLQTPPASRCLLCLAGGEVKPVLTGRRKVCVEGGESRAPPITGGRESVSGWKACRPHPCWGAQGRNGWEMGRAPGALGRKDTLNVRSDGR